MGLGEHRQRAPDDVDVIVSLLGDETNDVLTAESIVRHELDGRQAAVRHNPRQSLTRAVQERTHLTSAQETIGHAATITGC